MSPNDPHDQQPQPNDGPESAGRLENRGSAFQGMSYALGFDCRDDIGPTQTFSYDANGDRLCLDSTSATLSLTYTGIGFVPPPDEEPPDQPFVVEAGPDEPK